MQRQASGGFNSNETVKVTAPQMQDPLFTAPLPVHWAISPDTAIWGAELWSGAARSVGPNERLGLTPCQREIGAQPEHRDP